MRIWCLYLLGLHPFPFRTRRLSLKEPMILQGKPCGKVGRRQLESLKLTLKAFLLLKNEVECRKNVCRRWLDEKGKKEKKSRNCDHHCRDPSFWLLGQYQH